VLGSVMGVVRLLGGLLGVTIAWVALGGALRAVGVGPSAAVILMVALLVAVAAVTFGRLWRTPSPPADPVAAAIDPKGTTLPAWMRPSCERCRKAIGLDWHYDFESIALERTVAAQCPQCGRYTCREDLVYGLDGNYPPCQECGVALESLNEGSASQSMVRQALSAGRYRGVMRSPSAQGRPVSDD
jgi:hypothetical protein